MSRRAAAWLAWSMWTLSLPFVAFSGVLGFLSASSQTWIGLSILLLIPLLSVMYTTVGAVVASRRPENPIGWIFCAGGLYLSVMASANNYGEYALHADLGSLVGVQ